MWKLANNTDQPYIAATPRLALMRQFRGAFKRFLLIFASLFVISSISWLIWFSSTGHLSPFIDKQKWKWYELTSHLGLRVENVYLEGQVYSSKETILSALNIKQSMPLLALPLDKMRKHLESLEWINYTAIERVYPNALYVRVVEHTPIALWQHNGNFYIIHDKNGIIREANLRPFKNFIVMIGETAPLHANHFLNMVSKTPKLKEQIASVSRISERRWNVRFHSGLEVKLPEHDQEKAWQYIEELYNNKDIFNGKIRYIDLRVPNKIYIQSK